MDMDRIAEGMRKLEEALVSCRPWIDDPYTRYSAKVTPVGLTGDGRCFQVRTEWTDEWNDPLRPWVTERKTHHGFALLDPETGETVSEWDETNAMTETEEENGP